MASPDRFQPFSRLVGFFNRDKAPADPVGIGENKTGKLVDEFGRKVVSLDDLKLIGFSTGPIDPSKVINQGQQDVNQLEENGNSILNQNRTDLLNNE